VSNAVLKEGLTPSGVRFVTAFHIAAYAILDVP
jgi:hypothetical protein